MKRDVSEIDLEDSIDNKLLKKKYIKNLKIIIKWHNGFDVKNQ